MLLRVIELRCLNLDQDPATCSTRRDSRLRQQEHSQRMMHLPLAVCPCLPLERVGRTLALSIMTHSSWCARCDRTLSSQELVLDKERRQTSTVLGVSFGSLA